MRIVCPKCRRPIPLEDVDVSADTALCRACGGTIAFSKLLSAVSDAAPTGRTTPPSHVKVESAEGSLTITHRRFCKVAFFVIPFTMVWGGLSLGDLYGKQFARHSFSWLDTLFGLPFLAGTVALVALSLFLSVGKTRIRLEAGKGSVFMGVGALGHTRRFAWTRQTYVRATTDFKRPDGTKGLPGIVIEDTDRGALPIFANFTKEERDFIAGAIAGYFAA